MKKLIAILALTPLLAFAQIPATTPTKFQPLDPDLTAISALSGTNTIYYRSAANTWSPVTIGSNLTFSGGTLSASGGGGTVSDTAFASSWNGVTTDAPSKNAAYDYLHLFDTDDDGKPNVLDLAAGIPKTDGSGILSLAVAGTDYVSPAGVLALAGFSSITGRIGSANLPLGAELYNPDGSTLAVDVGTIGEINFFGGYENDGATYSRNDDLFSIATAVQAVSFAGDGSGLTGLQVADLAANSGTRATLTAAVTNETDVVEIFEDFLKQTVVFFSAASANSGSAPVSTSTGASSTRPGLVIFSTSTSANGASFFNDGANNLWLLGSGGETVYETAVLITTLSDGTETFTVRAGWNDTNNADGTDGLFFRYIHSENSGRWVLVARSNSVETATNSSSTVAAATWYKLRIVLNAAGTSAEFFVNGTSVGTVASNIPTGAGRQTSPHISLVKSGGTTARTMVCDYIYLRKVLTSGR